MFNFHSVKQQSEDTSANDLDAFIAHHQAEFGGSPLVRLKTDSLFEARDAKGLTYEDLSILAAIYSCVGDKRGPVLITQDMPSAGSWL